jgi:uncharacterized protein (TIGR02466 family)
MISSIFSVPVYTSKDISQVDLCLELFNIAEPYFRETSPGQFSTLRTYNPGGTSTSFDTSNITEANCFCEFIKKHIQLYLEEVKWENYQIIIPNLWFLKMVSGSSHKVHHHYGYTFSGVYYVTAPENSDKIILYNTLNDIFHHKLESKEFTSSNSYSWWFPTTPGTIILFPSYLKHSVPAAEFEGIRKSIAFDIILKPKSID